MQRVLRKLGDHIVVSGHSRGWRAPEEGFALYAVDAVVL